MNLDTLIAQEVMDNLKIDSPHNKVLVGRRYKDYEVMGFIDDLSNLKGLIKEGLQNLQMIGILKDLLD